MEKLRSELQQELEALRGQHKQVREERNKVSQELAIAQELLELSKKQISAKEEEMVCK